MHKALLALVLLAASLSGCAGSDADPSEPTQDSEGPRVSEGGSGPGANMTDPPHDKVPILSEDVMMTGQESVTFDVVVPDNVTNVDFHTTMNVGTTPVTSDPNAVIGFRLELGGCGVYDEGSSSASFGGVVFAGRLCKDAASGAQKVTVSSTGVFRGRLIIEGQIPKGNETAPA